MGGVHNTISEQSFMRRFGTKVADAGYSIVPIASGEKWPGEYSNGRYWPMKGWSFRL